MTVANIHAVIAVDDSRQEVVAEHRGWAIIWNGKAGRATSRRLYGSQDDAVRSAAQCCRATDSVFEGHTLTVEEWWQVPWVSQAGGR